MLALTIDGRDLALGEREVPDRVAGEVRIRTRLAGVCATDLEIARGYMGFAGVLGHEFVGDVLEADDPGLIGRRVVGGINASCGKCPTCLANRKSHCPHRTVLGILGRDGVMAESFLLPESNLIAVPDHVTDEQAVFAEPLAAACRIIEQVRVSTEDRVAVVGDGRLGLLCAWVLSQKAGSVTVFGRHPGRMPFSSNVEEHSMSWCPDQRFDLVVDSTGSPDGLSAALGRVRAMGTVVLKTTCAAPHELSLAPVVIDEVSVIGSRCGPIDRAIEWLGSGAVPVDGMIEGRFPLEQANKAFEEAGQRGVLKVLIEGPGAG